MRCVETEPPKMLKRFQEGIELIAESSAQILQLYEAIRSDYELIAENLERQQQSSFEVAERVIGADRKLMRLNDSQF